MEVRKMKWLIGIAFGAIVCLSFIGCNTQAPLVPDLPFARDEVSQPNSQDPALANEGEGGGTGGTEDTGTSVSTDDIPVPGDDVNGDPQETPLGVPGGIDELKKQPPDPADGPAEEDEAKED
jgi:hypothetical protein